MNQTHKKGKVKGTVLLTVVGIMMVMVVFLMSTLALTTAAQKRSYYTYYETQAQYAAQAALNAITSRAYADENFYKWVLNNVNDPAVPGHIDVKFEGEVLGISNPERDGEDPTESTVSCIIERLPQDNYVWDSANKRIYGQSAWKITATAIVGSGRNASTSSISNYIYANGHRSNAGASSHDTASWKNYSYEYAGTTTSISYGSGGGTGRGTVASAMATYSLAAGGEGSGFSNMFTLGPSYRGLGFAPDGTYTLSSSSYPVQMTNDRASTVGDLIAVGNSQHTTCRDYIFQSAGEGVEIYGNFYLSNGNAYFYSTYNTTKYKELGYVYVDGFLRISGGTEAYFGVSNRSGAVASKSAINIYAGGLDVEKGMTQNGDMYLYNPSYDSAFTPSESSKLAKFVGSNVQKTASMFYGAAEGGNFYCANNSIVLGTSNKKGLSFGGDVIITNPKATVTITEPITVGGNFICAGTVTFTGEGSITTPTGSVNLIANGNLNNTTLVTCMTNNANLFDGMTYTAYKTAMEAAKVPKDDGTDSDVSLWDSKYNLALMPYSQRLDEIFKSYHRWDLKSETETDVNKYVTAGGQTSADPAIRESFITGHTWRIDTVTEVDGTTYYVPCTDAKSTGTGTSKVYTNAFIDAIGFKEQTSAAYDNDPTRTKDWYTNGSYWSDVDQFKAWLTAETAKEGKGQTLVDYTTTAPSSTTPEFVSHKSDGSAWGATIDVGNSHYLSSNGGLKFADTDVKAATTTGVVTMNSVKTITNSCSLKPGDNTTYYVDPTLNGYSDDKPLVIFLTTGSSGTTFIVNNTVYNEESFVEALQEAGNDAVENRAYCSNIGKVAGRREVVFVFPKDSTEYYDFVVCTTGALAQVQESKFNAIANPYYPGQTQWSTLHASNNKDQYAFELIPNCVIYGQAGKKYFIGNMGGFVNGEILLFDSTFTIQAGNHTNTVYYRETSDIAFSDAATTQTASGALSAVRTYILGSCACNGFNSQSEGVIVYLGDTNRSVGTPDVTSSSVYNKKNADDDSSSGERDNDDRDFFNNHHEGAA